MSDLRPVFFFDIDNCVCDTLKSDPVSKRLISCIQLYSRSQFAVFSDDVTLLNTAQGRKVHETTAMLVHKFIKKPLSLDDDATKELHVKYMNEHSLIVQGLAQNHGIDPLVYNSHVDDALPLEELLVPDPELSQMLRDIDRTKVKLWLFTNAYVNHGRRVVRLLGIEDHFEGLTYCDYAAKPMHCKAMQEAGVGDVKACHFVGTYYPADPALHRGEILKIQFR